MIALILKYIAASRKHAYKILTPPPPPKPHFYVVKLGFIGVYIIFLISAQKHRLWVLVRSEAVLTSTHNLYIEQKYKKKISKIFLSQNLQFLEVNFFIYLNRHVFVTDSREYIATSIRFRYSCTSITSTSIFIAFFIYYYIWCYSCLLVSFLFFFAI